MMERNCNSVIIDDKFPSVISNKNRIIDIVINKLKEYPFSNKIDYNEFFLLIDEALSNAMEHGNNWDPAKLVNVEITRTDDFISITIEDEGAGFDINRCYVNRNRPHLNPRGRGIQIIKHFCKPMWNITGNKINFCINIK